MFREKNVDPRPGMVFALDNSLAKILAVSGARVMTDFNNPLSGKHVKYKFNIVILYEK
jgi:FKBP-type peptidyl-prolyl cis-trans isomerase 2